MPDMPPFAIAELGGTIGFLTYFLNKKIPVIDGTSIKTVHQNHDYEHIKSTNNKTTNKGIERDQNKAIANLKNWQVKDISDCTHILNNDEIFRFQQLEKFIERSMGMHLVFYHSLKINQILLDLIIFLSVL